MDSLISKRDALYNKRRYAATIKYCNVILSCEYQDEITKEIKDRTCLIEGISYYAIEQHDMAIKYLDMCKCNQSKLYNALSNKKLWRFQRAITLFREIVTDDNIDKNSECYRMSKSCIISLLLQRINESSYESKDNELKCDESKGNIKEIFDLFLEYSDDINTLNESGETLLDISVLMDYKNAAHLLLDLGANPLVSDELGTNSFHIAIINNRWYIINYVLNLFCDAVVLEKYHDTPIKFRFQRLLQILKNNKTKLIEMLTISGYKECINILNDHMLTSDHCAICGTFEYMSTESPICICCYDKIALNKNKFKLLETCFLCGDKGGEDLLICRKCDDISNSLYTD